MPKKPTGKTGPIRMSNNGIKRELVEFPAQKEQIEQMIAELFVKTMDGHQDDLKPFSNLKMNRQNDVDFLIDTSLGTIELELTEFAPLRQLGITKHIDAPSDYSVGDMTDMAMELILKKSNHYGTTKKILVIYKTQSEFLITYPVIDLLRRRLSPSSINFLKIYFLSPHGNTGASVSLVYPAKPHGFYEHLSDESLAANRLSIGFKKFRRVIQFGGYQISVPSSQIKVNFKVLP